MLCAQQAIMVRDDLKIFRQYFTVPVNSLRHRSLNIVISR